VSGLWQWDRLVGSGMGASIPWRLGNWQVTKWTSDFWKSWKFYWMYAYCRESQRSMKPLYIFYVFPLYALVCLESNVT
jgi:hypothetical protein